MFREVVFFESLFKSNLWIWALGWLFHVGLALVLLRHLRYFTEPVNFIIAFIQPFGMYAGFAMAAGLAGLWARRFLVERIRYISTPSDHLMLALLLGIAVTGLAMKFLMHTDVVAVKTFFLGLMVLRNQSAACAPRPLPASGHGRAADDRVPRQQAAACPRRVLLADPQPGRQPARNPPSGALGGQNSRIRRTDMADETTPVAVAPPRPSQPPPPPSRPKRPRSSPRPIATSRPSRP
jgi:hypothetical protein